MTQNQQKSMIPPRRDNYPVPPFNELNMMGFGVPGSGKTRFFSGDKDIIVVGTEPGQSFTKARVVPIRSWNAFKHFVHEMGARKKSGTLDCSGVAIDIVDNLHTLCQDSICQAKGFAHPNDDVKGYGRLWGAVTKEWKGWIGALMDITNVHFVTHCKDELIEIEGDLGIKEEITRFGPTFSRNKAAQYLDGIVSAVGYFTMAKDGTFSLTFHKDARIDCKDRTDILTALGQIKLPSQPELGFGHVAKLYEAKAKEMGFVIQTKR